MKNVVYHKLMHSKLYNTLTNEIFNPYSLALSKTTVEPLISGHSWGSTWYGKSRLRRGQMSIYLCQSAQRLLKWYGMWMHV